MRIPHGTVKVTTARKKWDTLYKAAQDGTDPAKTFDAVQDFAGIAEAMFIEWSKAEPDVDRAGYWARYGEGPWLECNDKSWSEE